MMTVRGVSNGVALCMILVVIGELLLVVSGYRWQHKSPTLVSFARCRPSSKHPPAETATSTTLSVLRTGSVGRIDEPVKSRVRRMYEDQERVPLESLQVGQKLRGRIISIADYGLFVDVGTKRDALVHIKDVSNSHFVTNLDSKFVPGQDVDVYVKFVLLSEKKLGLQMYPPNPSQVVQSTSQPAQKAARDVSITNLKPGMEVKGKVIRTSDFGVYVDIGAVDVTPFLHRRKIKSNRRQWKYLPGELVPLGSEVTCFVHEVDAARNRVGLTTYPPEQWAERLLPPTSEQRRGEYAYGEDDNDFDPMVEDNEELGGDVRAANLRALRRTLALQLDEGSTDEDGGNGEEGGEDSDDDDESGEVLSEAEIRRLTANRRGDVPGMALADDEHSTDESEGRAALAKAEKKKAAALGEDQYTTEELFESLSNRKPFLTLSDVKKWDYARLLMQDGDLTVPVLQGVFQRAGAVRGQLGREQFGLFLDLFAAELGLVDDDASFIDEEAQLSPVRVADNTMIPTRGAAGGNKKQRFAIDDLAEEGIAAAAESTAGMPAAVKATSAVQRSSAQKGKRSEFVELPDGLSVEVSESTTTAPAAAPPRSTQTLSDALFETFAQGKTHVDFETLVQKWDTLRSLIARDAGNAVRLRQSFSECAKASKVKGHVDTAGFARFVDAGVSLALAAMQQAADVTGAGQVQPVVSASTQPAKIEVVNAQVNDDDYEEISVDEAFLELSENGDGEFVTQEAVARWPLVADLLSEGYLRPEEFARMFQQASLQNAASAEGQEREESEEGQEREESEEGEEGRRGRADAVAGSGVAGEAVLDFDGFNALLDLLDPFASDEHDDKANDARSSETPTGAVPMKEVEESDEQVTRRAFEGIANGKQHVSLKDMLNWDFVYTLLAEEVLTEDKLAEMMTLHAGGNKKGVPYEGFDRLVDELVALYQDSDIEDAAPEPNALDIAAHGDELAATGGRDTAHDELDYADDDDTDENAVAGMGLQEREVRGSEDGDDEEDGGDEEDGVEEDGEGYVEVDTVREFERLSAGRGYVDLEDLKSWELIQDALAASGFIAADWRKVLEVARVRDPQRITPEEFEEVFDEVLARAGFAEEDHVD